MNIHGKILVLMQRHGLSQQDLAEKVGVSQASVSDWCKKSKPRKSAIKRLSDIFGLSPDVLMNDTVNLPDWEPTELAKKQTTPAFLEHCKSIGRMTDKKIASGCDEPPSIEEIAGDYSPQMQTHLLMEISEKLSALIEAFNAFKNEKSG